MSSLLVRLAGASVLAPVLALAGTVPVGALTASDAGDAPDVSAAAEPTATALTVPDVAPQAQTRVAGGEEVVASLERTATDTFQMVGITWKPGADDASLTAEVRTRKNGTWSAWQQLDLSEPDPSDAGALAGTDPMWVGDADGVAARVLSADGTSPEDVKVAVVDSPEQPEDAAITAQASDVSLDSSATQVSGASFGTALRSAAVAQPAIVLRSSWQPTTTYQSSCSSPTTATTQSGALLHHTAGANTYTQAQSPAYVRAAHLYHTKTQKWCDIGYNFLVDKYGTIYEGRRGGITKMVRGAHSGTTNANKYMVGISMMGNYDTAALTAPLKTSVANLIAWRLSIFGTPATGTMAMDGRTINRISGHRDVKATACPGRYGYAWLNDTSANGLRQMVTARMAGGGAVTPPAAAPRLSPTIQTTYNRYRAQLGSATSSTRNAKGGYTYANFSNGRVYAKGSAGYAIWGAIDKGHRAAKGTSGVMGVPTSSVKATKVGGVWFASFAQGRIYSRGATSYLSYGKVDKKHRALKGVSGRLGAPTRSIYRTGKGNYKATYTGGSISYNPKTNTYSVKYR
ncbi:N-acetylmuramoyl-L-alanine amidase [Solicola sp. PLA-1-18]|uniref:N-acetylmuramoyl-L-alanine amidase n=1 Tax=Solicola sp. PLA-1-18 TaxID=3380532 RepID=UPI003B795223